MTPVSPIKRSTQLAPLSREHHDGLIFVWKIRQGLKNNTNSTVLRSYVLWFWKHHIKQHFYQEEKILLPFFPPDHPLALQMTEEHENIRELILACDKEADKSTLTALCDLLERHIRFEERQFFAYLEEKLTPAQLDTIMKDLEAHPVISENWMDQFWEKTGS